MKKIKILSSIGILAPVLAIPLVAARCNNESKLKDLQTKYENNRKSVIDFLNSEEKYSFLKTYVDIKNALNAKVDIKSSKEINNWIKNTNDAISSYKTFKNSIVTVNENKEKNTFSAFDNLLVLSSKVSEKGKGFFPKTIINQLKSKNSSAEQAKLLNSFLESNTLKVNEESLKDISIDFENSVPNDSINSVKDGLTLTFVMNKNGTKHYAPITWKNIGLNNVEKADDVHSDEIDLSKVTENDKNHYLDDSFIIGKIFKNAAFSTEQTADKIFEKINSIVSQSSGKLDTNEFKKKAEELNELFAFETNLENDPSVSYSLIGSHAHSTKEYHFYLTKYVNNAKDSKISFIVHNQKNN
ncbi:variable surface lipoprotein [Mycoplasmopsis bovis]|uniref:Lipoprotein n=3 Tax=Mycoplasmopsis bovis TaxID=28903 RepID=A0A2N8U1Z8_MYCBV|nr:variable surface lipoprotein [Mycoplasmopsis bovis]AEI89968.1 lipoprotein [Mycoplasmopsis bovis Hubei-1]AFM51643.1 putative membrane lipoprotein [Mycoplasmopsis bovis HB0801]AIA33843.1 lipoprotein [Mycoplasmopsis bovis CQ-W70]AKO50470.1 hypothetical protein AAV31_01385 [Mycoplasmopsis bovis]AMW24936.1 lipoprotein [Mycoplasmopsis bovis]